MKQLDKVYKLQNERAKLLQEKQVVALEWKHFCIDNKINKGMAASNRMSSKRVISLWLEYQAHANDEKTEPTDRIAKWIEKIKWWWMKWICQHRLHINSNFDKNDLTPLIKELQTLYYLNRQEEIRQRIGDIDGELSLYDAKVLTETLTQLSMSLLYRTTYGISKSKPTNIGACFGELDLRNAQ